MASKNIVAKGTTYNGVESVTFQTSPSGTATFYEVSDTTATASDVLNSKWFYTAAGVKTQGTATGGTPTLITKNITANGTYNASSDNADGYSQVTVNVSGGGSWSWMGKNPVKIKDVVNEKVYVKNTGYASWAPSTTASTIVTARNILVENVDCYNYDYVLQMSFRMHYEYGSGATQTAMIYNGYGSNNLFITGYESNLSALQTDTRTNITNGGSNMLFGFHFKNASGTENFSYSTPYGIYCTSVGSATNTTIASGTIQVNTCVLAARCSTTTFSTTNAAALDQDASYYEYVVELWRVDRDTSARGVQYDNMREMWLADNQ